MSTPYRPHRRERRKAYALKMRQESLDNAPSFAPNKPRSQSIVSANATHKSKLGAQHVRKQLRRQPTFHGDVYQSTRLQTDYQDTSVGIKDNPTPFTQLSDTFTLTNSERAKLETLGTPEISNEQKQNRSKSRLKYFKLYKDITLDSVPELLRHAMKH
tara:strand:- start:584 stop:1057 length:474 start_codon:yes stop_codon:yes gene_type:complete